MALLLGASVATSPQRDLHNGVNELDEPVYVNRAKLNWRAPINDCVLYRRSEFRRKFKKFKSSYEGKPKPEEKRTYRIMIHQQFDHKKEHRQPGEIPIQLAIFGEDYFVPKQELIFEQTLEKNRHIVVEFEEINVGPIIAIGLGYESKNHQHNHPELFIEKLSIHSLAPGIRESYDVPCYRWFSKYRDDGSLFRFLWAHQTTDEDNEFPIRVKDLKYIIPAVSVRLCSKPGSRLNPANTFVEHCIEFTVRDYKWHIWYRYETLLLFNKFLSTKYPELNLHDYFPGKSYVPYQHGFKVLRGSKMIAERRDMLDCWWRHLFSVPTMLNDTIVKSLIACPSIYFLDNIHTQRRVGLLSTQES